MRDLSSDHDIAMLTNCLCIKHHINFIVFYKFHGDQATADSLWNRWNVVKCTTTATSLSETFSLQNFGSAKTLSQQTMKTKWSKNLSQQFTPLIYVEYYLLAFYCKLTRCKSQNTHKSVTKPEKRTHRMLTLKLSVSISSLLGKDGVANVTISRSKCTVKLTGSAGSRVIHSALLYTLLTPLSQHLYHISTLSPPYLG